MKNRLLAAVLPALLLLSAAGCGSSATPPAEEDTLHILATTYPVYLFTCAVTEGVDGIAVERLNTGETSCLHDYTLSVSDMKKLDGADVIVMNGVGLEEFMEDALATSDAVVIDCSEGVELLENLSHHHEEDDHGGHEGHDHGHFDPHYWMDPRNAQVMVENLRAGLTELVPVYSEYFAQEASGTTAVLHYTDLALREDMLGSGGENIAGLITFHDGFQYFAHAYGLPLLEAIEEEAGSEASAKEIVEITQLVNEHHIPVIFTEVNGSDATAKAIARETGCAVAQLSMIMDGREPTEEDSSPIVPFAELMLNNIHTLINGFAGQEVVSPS